MKIHFITRQLAALTLLSSAFASAEDARPANATELFQTTKVWTAHLRFTAEEWAAMEPKGGPGAGGPGPGGFGPAMFLAPAFLQQGDGNQDGHFSGEEFQVLAEKWFDVWDKEQTGVVNAEQLRAGLNASFAPPNAAPAGGGRPPGGPPLLGAEGKRNGLASAMGIEFDYVHADLEFAGAEFKDVAVRYKGNGTFLQSRNSPKRSLKIDLNKNVKGQKLLGLTTLNLHSNVTDASWMNEVLSHRLYREAKVPAPRTAYARVFATVPGKYDRQYLGLYSLIEDIDKDFADENFQTKKGAILKPVTPALFTDLGDAWSKYEQIYDAKDDLSVSQAQRVIDFARLVTKADDAEFAAKVGGFLDLREFARYMAVTAWLATMDSILAVGQNFYVHLHPKKDWFQFIPWDLDHSFGQFPMVGSQEQRETLSVLHPWRGENRFLERVFKTDEFQKLYRARLEEFQRTIFQPARLAAQVDEIAAAIRPAVKEESEAKLALFDRAVAGEAVSGSGFGPGPGQPVKPIKAFVQARARSVAEQLEGKDGAVLGEGGGFGPGGRPPGGRGGFGPGMFLGTIFMNACDADHDGKLTREETAQRFAKWFTSWNTDATGVLTEEQLRAGINKDLAPPRPGPPQNPPPAPEQKTD